MVFRKSLFVLLLAFCGGTVTAQPVISSADIAAQTGTALHYRVSVSGDVAVSPGEGGGNQVWDFEGVDYDSVEQIISVLSAENLTTWPIYPAANYALNGEGFITPGSQDWRFFELSDARFAYLGSASILGDDTLHLAASGLSYPLPLAFGDVWQVSQIDTVFNRGGFFIVDSIVKAASVDAWGTAQLIAGETPALRVKIDVTTFSKSNFAGTGTAVDTTRELHYQWLGASVFLLAEMVSQENETKPNFDTAFSFRQLVSPLPTSVLEQESEGAQSDMLLQVYPNPVTAKTRISFKLPHTDHVKLSLFSIRGRHIATLAEGEFPNGARQINWQVFNRKVSRLASGIYLLRLKTPSTSISQKIIILH